MKNLMKTMLAVALLLGAPAAANAQFGNIGKKLKEKAKQKIEQKVDQTINKTVNSAVDKTSDAVEGQADKVLKKGKKKVAQKAGIDAGESGSNSNSSPQTDGFDWKKAYTPGAEAQAKDIVENAHKYESGAMKNIFLKRPFYTLYGILRFLCGKIYRVILCPKKFWRFIAVEAPDGTGKTTFISSLVTELRKYYVSDEGRFCIHHFRPLILPNLGAVGEKAGVMKQDTDFTKPHRAKPAGKLSSFVRMSYYWLDYIFGIPYLLRKEVKAEKYTIFDRYIFDFVVDPKRSRISLPYSIRKLFAQMVIHPQIVFVLNTEPEVIYKRKQELELDEIKRQLDEFKKLDSICSNVVTIDAGKSVDEMVEQAIDVIFEKFLSKI